MTIIETKGEIDKTGNLKLHHPLKIVNKKVRVIVQVLEDIEKEREKEVEQQRTVIEKAKSKHREEEEEEEVFDEFDEEETNFDEIADDDEGINF